MPNPDGQEKQKLDYYSILGLPQLSSKHETTLDETTLKAAYRRTLLRHHPDKNLVQPIADVQAGCASHADYLTVDQISQAYETLKDPALRAIYDLQITAARKIAAEKSAKRSAASISETYDLEDFSYADDKQVWYKTCRCGDEYQITESQLEENSADGELIVGCHGCSLNIRVVFQVVES